jgi:ATP-binding cassette subfamily F protein uup
MSGKAIGATSGKADTAAPANVKPKTERPAKMTFAEKREFEALEKQLPELEAEKKQLEESMSSGTLSSQELMEQGQRMMALIAELEEKEMRWLELSEKA